MKTRSGDSVRRQTNDVKPSTFGPSTCYVHLKGKRWIVGERAGTRLFKLYIAPVQAECTSMPADSERKNKSYVACSTQINRLLRTCCDRLSAPVQHQVSERVKVSRCMRTRQVSTCEVQSTSLSGKKVCLTSCLATCVIQRKLLRTRASVTI